MYSLDFKDNKGVGDFVIAQSKWSDILKKLIIKHNFKKEDKCVANGLAFSFGVDVVS